MHNTSHYAVIGDVAHICFEHDALFRFVVLNIHIALKACQTRDFCDILVFVDTINGNKILNNTHLDHIWVIPRQMR